MGNNYQDNRKKLGAMLKTEIPKTPIQEVRPVEQPPVVSEKVKAESIIKKGEAHINFWVPEELMEQLKIHAIRSRKTIKQVGIEALEAYLSKH
ncbi:hypothetical protein [Spirosoma arcticum]